MRRREIATVSMTFLFCSLGSLLVGYLSYRGRIFQPDLAYFQFVASGLVCASYLALEHVGKLHFSILVGTTAVIWVSGMGPQITFPILQRNFVWAGALFAAIWICLWTDRRFGRLSILKVVVWAAVFCAVHFASVAVLTFAKGHTFDLPITTEAIRIGGQIGLGLALGHWLTTPLTAEFSD